MKKFLIILIASLTMLSCILTPSALDTFQNNLSSVENGILEEHVDNSGKIFRYFKKNTQSNQLRNIFSTLFDSQSVDNSHVEDILLLLGLNQSFIDELSAEDLDMYANAKSISSVTTYSVSNQNGNVTIIPEEIAIQNAASMAKVPTLPEDFGDGSSDLESEFGYFGDNYMQLTYLVVELGNGKYRHSINATWLDEPLWRQRDLIGACVESNSVDSATCSGWVKYLINHPLINDSREHTTTFSSSNFYLTSDSGWTGCGAIFTMPTDIYTDIDIDTDGIIDERILTTFHTNINAHFEFESTVPNTALASSFDSTASYDHATIYNKNKTIKIISTDGKTYVGLDMANITVDRNHADLSNKLSYTP